MAKTFIVALLVSVDYKSYCFQIFAYVMPDPNN